MPFTLREDELDEIILRAIRHGGREMLAHLQIMEKRIMSEFDDLSKQLDDVSTKEDANAAVLAQIQAAGIEIDTDIKDAISLIQQTNASVITEAQLGQIRDKLTAIQGKVAANSAAASAALTTTQADDAEWQASQAPVAPVASPAGAIPVNPHPAPTTQPGVNSDSPGIDLVDPNPLAAPVTPGSGGPSGAPVGGDGGTPVPDATTDAEAAIASGVNASSAAASVSTDEPLASTDEPKS